MHSAFQCSTAAKLPAPPVVEREYPHAVRPPHHVGRLGDDPPVVGLRGALTPAVRGEQSVRPHDAQHPRAGDSDPVQDPKPCVDLAMAFAVGTGTERDRSESPPAAARPIASAAAPASPAPRPAGGGVPAPAARRAPSASAPRPDTPAGCRNSAPSPRRSSRSSSRPPHRQREALLRGPGPLAEQLDLHRQFPDVTLRRVEHLRHWLAVTIL